MYASNQETSRQIPKTQESSQQTRTREIPAALLSQFPIREKSVYRSEGPEEMSDPSKPRASSRKLTSVAIAVELKKQANQYADCMNISFTSLLNQALKEFMRNHVSELFKTVEEQRKQEQEFLDSLKMQNP